MKNVTLRLSDVEVVMLKSLVKKSKKHVDPATLILGLVRKEYEGSRGKSDA